MAHGLNPAQDEAVRTLRGPLLVLAGAGTGKTRVVTFRIANLIRHGTPPDRILAVTFTNKAAGEMQERISDLIGLPKRGKSKAPRPAIGTFHAQCVQILRRHATRIGYPAKFAIYDRSDQESLARAALRDMRVHTDMIRPATCCTTSVAGRMNASGQLRRSVWRVPIKNISRRAHFVVTSARWKTAARWTLMTC